MSKPKQYRPPKCYVPDEDLNNLHKQLAERSVKTRAVARWLEDRADVRVFPCVQVALPVPVGKPEVLMLWLRVFRFLRSPTWRRPGRFVPDADQATIDRCRIVLEELRALCLLSASTRGEWSTYLQDAINLLQPRRPPAWTGKAFKANEARWGDY